MVTKNSYDARYDMKPTPVSSPSPVSAPAVQTPKPADKPATVSNAPTPEADTFSRTATPGSEFNKFTEGQTRTTISQDSGSVDGHGLNNTNTGMASASGRIPSENWDQAHKILGELRQRGSSNAPHNETGGQRCAAANLMAPAIMNGPQATSNLLNNVADAQQNQLTDTQRTELRGIAGRVENRSASFEDLNHAQHLLFRAGNTVTSMNNALHEVNPDLLNADENKRLKHLSNNNVRVNHDGSANQHDLKEYSDLLKKGTGQDSQVFGTNYLNEPDRRLLKVRVSGTRINGDTGGLDDGEMRNLSQQTGAAPPQRLKADLHAVHQHDASPAVMDRLLEQLQPGEAATMRVRVNSDAESPGHYVTVGRNPAGRPYMYNSDPGKGDHTLFVGEGNDVQNQPQNFRDALNRYSQRATYDGYDSDGETVTPWVHLSRPE